ncbi:helix-turn-helix domain-containing protein [Herbiconiux sp. 11R-BC]|uniref:TetR/AcrR family transcriptional regulator n=1 Tax=Herbiconiux sp. 11R-BC TaxID=3111637 RepID=UPI003C110C07
MTEARRRNPLTGRDGRDTKAEAQRVALSLFSTRGYDATSLREIAEELGITKASLYYHFKNKEDIVRSVMLERGHEAGALRVWLDEQPPGDDLLDRAVLRWIDAHSVEKMRGIRFITANPGVLRTLGGDAAAGVRDGLQAVVERVAGPSPSHERLLLIHMAFLSINAAVAAAVGTPLTDDEIVAAARESALAQLAHLRTLA